MYCEGCTLTEISAAFGKAQNTIWRVLKDNGIPLQYQTMSRNRTGNWEERYFKLEEEIQKVKKENKRLKNELEELENRNWWQRLFNIRKEDE